MASYNPGAGREQERKENRAKAERGVMDRTRAGRQYIQDNPYNPSPTNGPKYPNTARDRYTYDKGYDPRGGPVWDEKRGQWVQVFYDPNWSQYDEGYGPGMRPSVLNRYGGPVHTPPPRPGYEGPPGWRDTVEARQAGSRSAQDDAMAAYARGDQQIGRYSRAEFERRLAADPWAQQRYAAQQGPAPGGTPGGPYSPTNPNPAGNPNWAANVQGEVAPEAHGNQMTDDQRRAERQRQRDAKTRDWGQYFGNPGSAGIANPPPAAAQAATAPPPRNGGSYGAEGYSPARLAQMDPNNPMNQVSTGGPNPDWDWNASANPQLYGQAQQWAHNEMLKNIARAQLGGASPAMNALLAARQARGFTPYVNPAGMSLQQIYTQNVQPWRVGDTSMGQPGANVQYNPSATAQANYQKYTAPAPAPAAAAPGTQPSAAPPPYIQAGAPTGAPATPAAGATPAPAVPAGPATQTQAAAGTGPGATPATPAPASAAPRSYAPLGAADIMRARNYLRPSPNSGGGMPEELMRRIAAQGMTLPQLFGNNNNDFLAQFRPQWQQARQAIGYNPGVPWAG